MFKTDDPVVYFCRIISLAIIIVLVFIGIAYGAWTIIFSKMSDGRYDKNSSTDINSSDILEGEGNINDFDNLQTLAPLPFDEQEAENDVTPAPINSLTVLQNNIKEWISNGSPVSDKNITNILLIGNDVDSTRADAMMVLSINHNKKAITLASIMRDQYSYIVHDNKGAFEKFHHACAYGGPKLQIEMIEKYYKISIDNYAVVNFKTLPIIIDALGGVKVTLSDAEATCMRDVWWCENVDGAGTYTLSGEDALLYMRIRDGVGGDKGRVGRQQKLLKEVISMLSTYNKASLISLITDLTPHVRTGYTSNQMLSLAAQALQEGWFNYSISQYTAPVEDDTAIGFTVKNSRGQKIWYWKVDFPRAAQQMQKVLYGTTNITLEENRKSWL